MCAILLEVHFYGVALMLALTSHWNHEQWQLMAIPVNCYSSANWSDLSLNAVIESSRTKINIWLTLQSSCTRDSNNKRQQDLDNVNYKKKALRFLWKMSHQVLLHYEMEKKLDHHLIAFEVWKCAMYTTQTKKGKSPLFEQFIAWNPILQDMQNITHFTYCRMKY